MVPSGFPQDGVSLHVRGVMRMWPPIAVILDTHGLGQVPGHARTPETGQEPCLHVTVSNPFILIVNRIENNFMLYYALIDGTAVIRDCLLK